MAKWCWTVIARCVALAVVACAMSAPVAAVDADLTVVEPQQPVTLADLAGRWVGEGRLGLRDSPPETVKCRATYFFTAEDQSLKQTIRCATSGGSVEVKSDIRNTDGTLTGHWQETTRNISGDLKGKITPRGLRITVRGGDISANMDIVVRAARQIVEIQFIDSALVGLTLLLQKG